jgi:hypothetical protein
MGILRALVLVPALVGLATQASVAATGAGKSVVSALAPRTPVISTTEDIGPGVHGLLAAVEPQDGCTYSWTIVGGSFDSAPKTNQVTFGAGSDSSVILRCVVTNSAGQSASGSLTLFVPGGGLNPRPTTTVGGTVEGLISGQLVLQNDQGNNLIVTANGPFTFGVPVATGAPYLVKVLSQPEARVCTVTNGSGTVGQTSVTDILVACTPSLAFPISPPSASLGGRVVGSFMRALGPSSENVFILGNAFVADLDGDGYPEVILSIRTYPNQISQPILVVGAKADLSLLSDSMFVDGVPETQNASQMFTIDLNGDGLPDLVIGDAGFDHPPWTGGPIAVALNLGGGMFRNVSALLPVSMAKTRSYSVAAGDLHGDGKVEIILPDGGGGTAPTYGTLSETIRWNGAGFDEDPSWINKKVWAQPGGLFDASWLGVADLDGDGFQDVIVAGNHTRPNLRVLYGGATGFQLFGLARLPEGTWGHTPSLYWSLPGNPSSQGGDVDRVVIADFNNDGRPDIFALEKRGAYYQPGVYTDRSDPAYPGVFQNGGTAYGEIGLQVLLNQGGRVFTDMTSRSSRSNLGLLYYVAAWAVDLNNDGALDVVGLYWTDGRIGGQPGFAWGTTFFLNDGTGAFHVVDASALLPELLTKDWSGGLQLGSFFPTLVGRRGMEGVLVLQRSLNGKDLPLLIEKIVTEKSIGTGPGLTDGAALGAPGFNEFYYLQTHPDVANLVRGGSYSSGLDHYLRVGRSAGYQAFAQHTVAWGGSIGAQVALYGGNVYHCGGDGDTVHVTGGANVIYSGPGNDALSCGAGSDEVIYSGPRNRYQITTNADGSTTVADSVAGGDGTDTITGRFSLRFGDSTTMVVGQPCRLPVSRGQPNRRRPVTTVLSR